MLRDVAEVQLTRVKAHLTIEDPPSLIDCGYAGSTARIDAAMAAHGRRAGAPRGPRPPLAPRDPRGGARGPRPRGPPLLTLPADAANLRVTWRDVVDRPTRGRVFSAMTPEPPETAPIEDGQILPMLGGLR